MRMLKFCLCHVAFGSVQHEIMYLVVEMQGKAQGRCPGSKSQLMSLGIGRHDIAGSPKAVKNSTNLWSQR